MTREEKIKEVFLNKDILILQKKNALKHGDAFAALKGDSAKKAESMTPTTGDLSSINVKAVINTTNLIDSHLDVHIPNLWKKNLSEFKGVRYWLQEHKMDFSNIVADSQTDGLKVYTESISWAELGYPYKGETQALIFESEISKGRNEFMFNQYLKGYVLNHSVGMRYVKVFLCIDSDAAEYAAEKENWNKYYPQVVNQEKADENGYFWAVTEAMAVEGSAVVIGSNGATPTLEVNETKDIEPSGADTQKQDELADNSHNVTKESEQQNKLSIQNFI